MDTFIIFAIQNHFLILGIYTLGDTLRQGVSTRRPKHPPQILGSVPPCGAAPELTMETQAPCPDIIRFILHQQLTSPSFEIWKYPPRISGFNS